MADEDNVNRDRTVCTVLIILSVVAVIIFMVNCYTDLEFWEMGFRYNTVTKYVDTSRYYASGRHWLGPATKFRKFDALVHHVEVYYITVFASTDKVEITMSFHWYYSLIRDELKYIKEDFDVNYRQIIASTGLDTLKEVAGRFTIDQYLQQREEVEKAILHGLRLRLSGSCCRTSKSDNSTCDLMNGVCRVNSLADCPNRNECSMEEKGSYVDVLFLHLIALYLPSDVETKNLDTLLLQEEVLTAQYNQNKIVITKETERQSEAITNTAKEHLQEAGANATLIEEKSEAKYQVIIRDAYRQGLKTVYTSLSITDGLHKGSYDYLKTLAGHDKANLLVGDVGIILNIGDSIKTAP